MLLVNHLILVSEEATHARMAPLCWEWTKMVVQAGHVCVGWLHTNQSRIIPVHLLDSHSLSIQPMQDDGSTHESVTTTR